MSILEAFGNESFLSGLARVAILKEGRVSELLYQGLQLGINGTQYVNEFPQTLAADICQRYGVTKESKVLDPCAGWGGRMLGVSVYCNHYFCCEPSERTYLGLARLEAFIQTFQPEFTAEIFPVPFEDAYLDEDGPFDLILTSPPYYDTEEYDSSETNSLNRYKSFDAWVDGFYLPMIDKSLNLLTSQGVFILNVGNRVYPLDDILLSHFDKRAAIKNLGNLLSGNGGLGKEGGASEKFFEILPL